MRTVSLFFLALVLVGCGPKEGTPEWCESITNKPTDQLSMHEKDVFMDKCVFGSVLDGAKNSKRYPRP